MSFQLTESQSAKKILNLGCGQYPMADALNVDIIPQSKTDVLLDLNQKGNLLALPHGHYDKIVMHHVLEHLDNPFGIIRESAELLSPGGRMEIQVPHASRGFTHTEHKHGFDVGHTWMASWNLAVFECDHHSTRQSFPRTMFQTMVLLGWWF